MQFWLWLSFLTDRGPYITFWLVCMCLPMMHSVGIIFIYVVYIYEFLMSFCCDIRAHCTFCEHAQLLEAPCGFWDSFVPRPFLLLAHGGGPEDGVLTLGVVPRVWPASTLFPCLPMPNCLTLHVRHNIGFTYFFIRNHYYSCHSNCTIFLQ